ncbi:hypothetical protein [Acuticoccus kandeliae]|uniref:hypothetical protein n=1 Tax=Acuticoccus kandeliae TaxID=2073160 RepID=UPI001300B95E|nr:hypothetical protein [Acuticoccus kandeliae]
MLKLRLFLLSLFKPVFLIFAVINGLMLVENIPAANSSLRVTDAAGNWRVDDGAALLEGNAYLREQSYEHLRAAVESGEPDTILVAVEAARRGLKAAPSDVYAWTLLAWGQTILENDVEAQRALKRSWVLAPYSGPLALDRVLMSAALGYFDASKSDPAVKAAIRRDVRSLAKSNPRAVQELLNIAPEAASTIEAVLAEEANEIASENSAL